MVTAAAYANVPVQIKTSDEAGYEKVLTVCQDSEAFTKITVVKQALDSIGLPLASETDLKISILDAPHHGILAIDEDRHTGKTKWAVWRYSATQHFIGKDRAIFLVEEKEKKYKIVVNLNIESSIEDRVSPACEKMTFDFSPITMAAVGDMMLGGSPLTILQKQGYDYPFAKTLSYFKDVDIVFGNLEGPLTFKGSSEPGKRFVFRTAPEKVSTALRKAGFTIVGLANNHTYDYGINGLYDTIDALNVAGIAYAGAGINAREARKPAILNIKGSRIAVLSYCLIIPENFYATDVEPGIAFGDEASVRADVAASKKQSDIVIVAFHWGREGTSELEDYQRKMGHVAIDAGAAAVIGSHPHVLQGIERYKDGVILYSLGNFTFGSYTKTARVSAIASLSFEFNRVSSLRLYPVNVDNFEVKLQPLPLTGKAADQVVTLLQKTSAQLGTTVVNDKGSALLQFQP